MNRLGFRHDNLRRTLPELLGSPNLRLEAVYTHFAIGRRPGEPVFNEQRVRFEAALTSWSSDSSVRRRRRHELLRHAVQQRGAAARLARLVRRRPARAAALRHRAAAAGVDDSADAGDVADQPRRRREGAAARRRRRLRLAVHAPTTPRTIAVVPAGYADGLDTRLGGRGHVLIRGRRVPIVGAVSMDMITVDVTGLDDVQPGDEVVLLGRQGDESWQQIDAREMAAAIGTIPWEIVCRLGTRIERQYS